MKYDLYVEIFFVFLVIGLSVSFTLYYTSQALFFLLGIIAYSAFDAYIKKDL
jgi:hypothetical protein